MKTKELTVSITLDNSKGNQQAPCFLLGARIKDLIELSQFDRIYSTNIKSFQIKIDGKDITEF
ncbi:MAG TPA: hypothetical protein PKX15_00390 [Bacteroidales bacterium]|nr:hypothetical protein [Bacteroidales bacterium]